MRSTSTFYYSILLTLFFTACDNPQQSQSSESGIFAHGAVCYLNVTGNNSEDSSKLVLSFIEGKYYGTLSYYPYQKDKREGILFDCKRNGNIINASWMYQQEGMNDTIPVSFKIAGKNILRQPTTFDRTTGKETLDRKAGYTIEYKKTTCPE